MIIPDDKFDRYMNFSLKGRTKTINKLIKNIKNNKFLVSGIKKNKKIKNLNELEYDIDTKFEENKFLQNYRFLSNNKKKIIRENMEDAIEKDKNFKIKKTENKDLKIH